MSKAETSVKVPSSLVIPTVSFHMGMYQMCGQPLPQLFHTQPTVDHRQGLLMLLILQY